MRAWVIACVALCALFVGHERARAEGPVDLGASDWEPLPRPRPLRARKGTHFLAELGAGVAPGSTVGPAGALLFGGGGRPRTTSLRLYALAELSFAKTDHAVPASAPSLHADERSYLGFAGGARLYIPTVGRLRLFLDALGGASYNHAELTTATTELGEGDFFVQGSLAGGMQYRLLRTLSLGARVKWTASDDPLSDLREELGLSSAFPWAVTGAATWHF
jgi:hypothetical protein